MVLKATLLAILLAATLVGPGHAASRSTLIAMAVALLDVAREHCDAETTIDGEVKANLMSDFHNYEIGGLASAISGSYNFV